MGKDPIRTYIDAKRELDKALSKVHELQANIGLVNTALKEHPYSFRISGMTFPASVPIQHGLNPNDWPSAEQIGEALVNLHNAHDHAESIWASLSKADRQELSPPPPRRTK